MLIGWVTSVPPLLLWGIFSRLLGGVFLISYCSLYNQVLALPGEQGVLPARLLLDHVRRDFPGWKRFLWFPTLFWLNSGNAMVRGHVVVGIVASLLALLGGPWTPLAIGVCYAMYVSMDRSVGLVFPWDCVLFEAGFFGMFLPGTLLLPQLSAAELPAPALCWAYRLLAFRVLLGFGKFKFIGSTKEDWGYLTGFLINQPLVSPAGWYLHKAPLWLLKVAMFGMFFVEIPAPFLLLLPNWVGALGAISIAGLMIGIWVCGNFGYFNLIVMVLCVAALDTVTPRQLDWHVLLGSGHAAHLAPTHWAPFVTAVVLFHTLCVPFVFPFNSFCGQAWTMWPTLLRFRPRILTWPFHVLRWLQPFRWLHPYGVFPPKTMPGVRCIPLIEASWNGTDWVECPHQFSPTAPDSAPCFIAPHHPRGDQVAVYEGFGLGDGSIIRGVIGSGNPYGYTKSIGSAVLAQRMLDGSARHYGNVFFAPGTLRADQPPPVSVRVTTHALTPLSMAEHKATGLWWKREYIGPHLAPVRHDPDFYAKMFLPPECWHLEDVIWRRRSRLTDTLKALRGGMDADHAVLVHAPELAPYVDRFWNELIVTLRDTDRTSWQSMPDLIDALRARYDEASMFAFERLLGRYSFLLSDKLDDLFFDAGFLTVFGLKQPTIAVKSYLHLAMLQNMIVSEGKDAFEKVLRDPLAAREYTPLLTVARGLYPSALFRYDNYIYEAQKLRLLFNVTEPKRVQFSFGNPKLTAAMDEIAKHIFGVVEVAPFVREQFRGERFEQGYPERYPTFRLDPSGVVVRDDVRDDVPDAQASSS